LPLITTQPQAATVTSGQPASFSVVASSTDTLAYQWSRGGVVIAGATAATYAITATHLSDSGATFRVAVTNSAGTTTSNVAGLTVNAAASAGATAQRPFSDQSLWNARPTQFTLGSYVIPTSSYYPNIANGAYSVAAAIASSTDAPQAVMGLSGQSGIYIADAETYATQIVIPHWPANVVPASGSDGHADIIDVANNRIHSFWQLGQDSSGQWRAAQYTWTALDGTGWGTPGEYQQGSRATGVVSIAGLIRASEVDDGQAMYKHALTMSLTYNALSASPTFVFPATTADSDAASTDSGSIPEGSRLMLPASFDLSSITDARLIKIVQTLKTYGAYVTDRNSGTPFFIYVENGANFNLMPNGWDQGIANQLDTIRAALRQVVGVSQWVDANGTVFTPTTNLNLFSMRGPWSLTTGTTAGVFDTWQQAVVFPNNGQATVQTNNTGRTLPSIMQTLPATGTQFRVTVHATGGARMRLVLNGLSQYFDSNVMNDGDSVVITWPASWAIPCITAYSGPQGGGTVSATMLKL